MNEDALILVVEDDPNDALLLQDAFRSAGIPNPLKMVGSGEQAMDYLSRHGPFANREDYPVPSLIFTDLHLPRTSGLQLVRWIKNQPGFAEIPVIAMTGWEDRQAKEEGYEAGANVVFCKPAAHHQLVEEVRLICEHLLVT